MPKIAERGIQMPESPIRKLVPYAEEAKKRGVKVYHLNIGQPDIFTPEVAVKAIKGYNEKVAAYGHSAGNESYRKKLAEYYNNKGFKVNSNNILVTTGASEAILFTFLACFNAGDEVIIPEPFYTNYNAFAISAGIKIIPITSKIEDGFALPPISEFEKVITPRTKGIMISSPNNPTGYLYSRHELEQLKDLVLKYDLYLLSDEVYCDFCYDGEIHQSVMLLDGLDKNIILFDSTSKRYSECGVRVGMLVSRNKDVISTILKFSQSRLCPPLIGQLAGEASLLTSKEYFQSVYNEYVARRNFVINALNTIPGVFVPLPKGAFYSVVRLPIDNDDKFCQWLLEKFHYNNETVMLAPASGFYATPGLGKNEVRIAYVLNVEDLRHSVKIIQEALKVYPGRTL